MQVVFAVDSTKSVSVVVAADVVPSKTTLGLLDSAGVSQSADAMPDGTFPMPADVAAGMAGWSLMTFDQNGAQIGTTASGTIDVQSTVPQTKTVTIPGGVTVVSAV